MAATTRSAPDSRLTTHDSRLKINQSGVKSGCCSLLPCPNPTQPLSYSNAELTPGFNPHGAQPPHIVPSALDNVTFSRHCHRWAGERQSRMASKVGSPHPRSAGQDRSFGNSAKWVAQMVQLRVGVMEKLQDTNLPNVAFESPLLAIWSSSHVFSASPSSESQH